MKESLWIRYTRLKALKDAYKDKAEIFSSAIQKDEAQLQLAKEGSILVSKAIEDTHKCLETSVISTVNKALKLVFDDPYEMCLRVTQRGSASKTSQVNIVLKKNGVEVDKNLQECVCGGQLVVISIILRIAFILLNKEHRRILLLDEALGSLSRVAEDGQDSNLQKAVKMLEKLADAFKVQMLIITHTGADQ